MAGWPQPCRAVGGVDDGQRKWGLGTRTRKPCTTAAQPTLRPGAAAPCSPAGGLGGCFWTGRGQLKGWKSEAPPRKPGSRPLRAGRGGDGSRAPTAGRGSAPARSSTAPTVSALCASCHEARPGRREGMCPPEPVHLQEAGFHVTVTLKVPSSPHQQQRVAGFLCARDEGRCDKSPQARSSSPVDVRSCIQPEPVPSPGVESRVHIAAVTWASHRPLWASSRK
ncbi:uncharacterized protein LOC107511550 [Rousettus aegyptiacus]|uniref:uncharacterized protein LOC107511550 n=1 Tax=Rousettus aegyptiacus TaxID=9407 RepID=UPI00168D13D2|nr:uncharacterized protein LOC107511550 [Rousettus aegyptiacus]